MSEPTQTTQLPLLQRLINMLVKWLLYEAPPRSMPLCDFERLSYEIRPCDVLLLEGRTRVSDVIRTITQSAWTHATLYIGRLHDIENPSLRERVSQFYDGDPHQQLLIESVLGKGTAITPLETYKADHIRICRPTGISRKDAQRAISYAIGHLGAHYDIRQLLDLARFLLPWGIFPRRWRSSLFNRKPGKSTKTVCSTLIAEAFGDVHFPILPILRPDQKKGLELRERNPRLMIPSDFDYSPYFEIIKYPFLSISEQTSYQNLPWDQTGTYHHDEEEKPAAFAPDGKNAL